jgi:hypothetical protein
VIGSTDPEADHRFLRDVLGLPAVDGGGGYLIFGLPPAEVSVHPSSKDNLQHELYFLCDNIDAFISEMHKHSVPCGPVQHEGRGLLTGSRCRAVGVSVFISLSTRGPRQ